MQGVGTPERESLRECSGVGSRITARVEETRVRITCATSMIVLVAALAVPSTATAAQTQGAAASSLPAVASGARPGPDVLYAPAPTAPQLENRDPRFRADPLLVSGTEAYIDGEYLYQDHLFDDYGANTDGQGASSLSARAGDITYPTKRARYAGNAADLVELRIAVADDEVAYRFTLNTLLESDSTIIALAFDTDGDVTTGAATLPGDPGAPFPGTDELIATWGTGAEHHDLSGPSPAPTGLDVTTDLEANQITVTVPRTVSNPSGTWTATLAVGLHDGEQGWLLPQSSATETEPGGAGPANPSPSGIFNLGFRFDEPVLAANTPPDTDQSAALASGTPTDFAHEIDFDALEAGVSRSGVPTTGRMIRIFPSRLQLPEGQDLDAVPAYGGQLQPYSLYVPTTYEPGTPAPFTLNLHSLGQEHWQYNGAVGVFGEPRGSLEATPMGRGPDLWYQHEGEVDTFEVWNDVARHYTLDPDRTAITGYSMGGYGTYRLGGLYPDLFGAAVTIVGPPGDGIWIPPGAPTGGAETLSNLWLENVRNLPFMNLAAGEDELVPIVGPRAQNLGAPEHGIDGFEQLGYRYRFEVFPAAEHFTIAVLGYDVPQAAEFMGEAVVDRNPSHVTFSYLPSTDVPDLGLVHDHAYWVADVRLADDSDELAKATVDAYSLGFGVGHPTTVAVQDAGVSPLPYVETGLDWEELPAIEALNAMEVTLTNVASAELDVARAGLDPAAILRLEVTSDSAGELVLAGAFPPGTTVMRDESPVAGASAGPDSATIPIVEGEQTIILSRAEPGELPSAPNAGGAPLPTTGGGLVALSLGTLLAGAALTRRHRRSRVGGAGSCGSDLPQQ